MTITVHTPFLLTHDDHSQQFFAVGDHTVSAAVAAHWYVRAHSHLVVEHPESRQSSELVGEDVPRPRTEDRNAERSASRPARKGNAERSASR